MNRWALAWAVPVLVASCSNSSKVLERSAPERPAWVDQVPTARGQLYFTGTCTDLPNYQEALQCARAEALLDVTAWVGGRFSSYVYGSTTEQGRRGGSSVYFDSDIFLIDVRRTDTYYEVRQESWGRSYVVSVLLSYPRQAAEAERAEIAKKTDWCDGLVTSATDEINVAASEGDWGDAMNGVLLVATEVAVPRNFDRAQHLDQIAVVARELITPLQISAKADGSRVLVQASYRDAPARGVPVECLKGRQQVTAVSGTDGRAVCETGGPPAGKPGLIKVRPDIDAYLAGVPDEAGDLAVVLGELLDHSTAVDMSSPLDMTVALTGGRECDSALGVVINRLTKAGVRVSQSGEGETNLEFSCSVRDGAVSGDLYSAAASGAVVLDAAAGRVQETLSPVNGAGASLSAARDEALQRLGSAMSDVALRLLSGLVGGEEI